MLFFEYGLIYRSKLKFGRSACIENTKNVRLQKLMELLNYGTFESYLKMLFPKQSV